MTVFHENEAWRRLSTEPLLVTPFIEVRRDRVLRHDGSMLDYEVVRIPRDAVGIVAVRNRREVLMLRQYRYPSEQMSYEIPAGGIDDGETIEAAARRECREETGWDCPTIIHVQTYRPIVGRSNVQFHITYAPDPIELGDPTDLGEVLETFWADQDRFADLWKQGQIWSGDTIMGMLLAMTMGWLDWDVTQTLGKGLLTFRPPANS